MRLYVDETEVTRLSAGPQLTRLDKLNRTLINTAVNSNLINNALPKATLANFITAPNHDTIIIVIIHTHIYCTAADSAKRIKEIKTGKSECNFYFNIYVNAYASIFLNNLSFSLLTWSPSDTSTNLNLPVK